MHILCVLCVKVFCCLPGFQSLFFIRKTAIAILLGMLLSVNYSFGQVGEKKKFLHRLKTKHGLILPIPVVTYSPETSFGFGMVGQYLFRFPKDSIANLSTLGTTFIYTL